jgi:hypothetical protein
MAVLVTMNEQQDLPDGVAEADLRAVLKEFGPDIAFLQEWPAGRDDVLRRVCRDLGYDWARPEKGGPPVLWKTRRGRSLRSCKAVRLARAEFVGHLVGRKPRLAANYATEVNLNEPNGDVSSHLSYHLTADVQDVRGGNGYKKDPRYLLRCLRHRREKHRLGRRMRRNKRRGRDTDAGGDGNFSGMKIGGFHNCWEGHPGGSLGGRPVDIVFTPEPAKGRPRTYKTRSDHRAVAVSA